MQWNTTQQWKGAKFWQTQQHGWTHRHKVKWKEISTKEYILYKTSITSPTILGAAMTGTGHEVTYITENALYLDLGENIWVYTYIKAHQVIH